VRVTAIGCGVLAIAGRLLYDFELELREPFVVWFLGAAVANVLIPFGLLAIVIRRARVGAGLRVDAEHGRFVADSNPRLAYLGLMLFVLAGGFVSVERVPNTHRMRLYTDPWLLSADAIVLVIFLTAAVAVMRNRPSVVLDRDGVSVVGPLRSQRWAWTETVAYSTYLDLRKRWLYMQTATPDPATVRVAKVPVGWLDVDPMLLQHAIRTYADQPQRRAEIGTESELARLTADARTPAASHAWPR
jgi:hypothetical protein